MSEYESLRNDIEEVGAAMARYAGAVSKHVDAVHVTFDQLWAANAELRDELHALANRVETLTRARLTEPAEVAEAVFSPSRWQACECGTDVRRGASDGLIYDRDGLHTCRASA